MAHSTGAAAPFPIVPPARNDRAAQSAQATAQIAALREAYHAAACVHDLILQVQSLPRDKRHIDSKEVEALINFIAAECERRAEAGKATIASMLVPPKP